MYFYLFIISKQIFNALYRRVEIYYVGLNSVIVMNLLGYQLGV